MEAWGQYGCSPSGCEAAACRQQLFADLHPLHVHHVLDVENAHSAIARIAVLNTLLLHADSPTATRHDQAALTYFLLFYAALGPTITQAGPSFVSVLQTDALDQGDGLANYFYNLTYSPLVYHFITNYPRPPNHPP